MTPSGKVALIAHDAGGAEILSSWIKRNPRDYVAVLSGPAIEIFKRKILSISIGNLDNAIKECSWVLSGTGNSGWELEALHLARKNGLYIVSFLDHWTSYDKRFIRNSGEEEIPDEIWVGDYDAIDIVRQKIPNINSKLVHNPYWADVVEQYKNFKPVDSDNSILYVSSDFKNSILRKKQKSVIDYQVLEQIMESFQKWGMLDKVSSLTIRRHPSEPEGKYREFSFLGLKVTSCCDSDLVSCIVTHSYVVGCNSMAQVIAKLCDKYTINFLVDGYYDGVIPSKYIDRTIRMNQHLEVY